MASFLSAPCGQQWGELVQGRQGRAAESAAAARDRAEHLLLRRRTRAAGSTEGAGGQRAGAGAGAGSLVRTEDISARVGVAVCCREVASWQASRCFGQRPNDSLTILRASSRKRKLLMIRSFPQSLRPEGGTAVAAAPQSAASSSAGQLWQALDGVAQRPPTLEAR